MNEYQSEIFALREKLRKQRDELQNTFNAEKEALLKEFENKGVFNFIMCNDVVNSENWLFREAYYSAVQHTNNSSFR